MRQGYDKVAFYCLMNYIDELQFDERKPPELLQCFHEKLLLSKNKSETYTCFVNSFSSDIMFAISNMAS